MIFGVNIFRLHRVTSQSVFRQARREKFARGSVESKLRMNLRTSFVKISWIEDEIRKKKNEREGDVTLVFSRYNISSLAGGKRGNSVYFTNY